MSLKHRMLGAAVLIALAVIFIPMFMSSAPPPKTGDTDTANLAIPPAPEREFQDRVLPIDPAAKSPTTPAEADSNHIATVDTATAPPPTPVAEPAAPSAPPASATAKPEPPPAPVAQTKAESKPTAEPKLVPGQAANGRFFVHLGVYTSKANADELVAVAKKGGYPAFAESSNFKGKPALRVRAGPFENRAAAEAARLKIKQLKPDVSGSVLQLAGDARTDAPVAALPPNRAGAYAVQLGAVKSEADANKLRDKIKSAGFAAFVDKVDSNGATLWRVRAGPEVDRSAADRLRAGIKEKLKLDGMIVTQQ